MKKILICAGMILCFSTNMQAYAEDEPEISAKAAVVISADTGEIIYGKNYNEKLPMASTTKIMTTLLCLESGNLYDEFVVDSDAIKVEGSSMGLMEGDIVTKYALCCGMLLPSGNDAANATAVKLAGSIENFAVMMNEKAEELGLSNTYFVTPSGLEGTGHGSSAYDMAVLASVALKNDIFREICSSQTIKLEFGNPPYTRWLKNTNKLLAMDSGVYGVKTGFTDEAGRCLVSACEREGENLICVTLNDRNDWNDHLMMYDYAFEQAEVLTLDIPENISLPLAGSENNFIKVCAQEAETDITVYRADENDIEYKVISHPFVYAPIFKGDELAYISVRYKEREIKNIPLYAAENAQSAIPEQKQENIFGKVKNFLFGKNQKI